MEEKTPAKIVGEKIAALRKERGLTQKQLAEKIYTSDKNLSKWETGKALPSLEFLLSLCAELNVPIDAFTDENFTSSDILNAQRQKRIKSRLAAWVSAIAALAGVPLFILAAARAYLPSPLPVHFNSSLQPDRMGDVRELSVGAMILFFCNGSRPNIVYYLLYQTANGAGFPHGRAHKRLWRSVFVCVAHLCGGDSFKRDKLRAGGAKRRACSARYSALPRRHGGGTVSYLLAVRLRVMFVPRNDFFGFRIPSAYESDFNWRVYNLAGAAVLTLLALTLSLVMIYMPRPLKEAEALAGSLAPLLPALVLSYALGKAITARHDIIAV